jgi:hypothetical protein
VDSESEEQFRRPKSYKHSDSRRTSRYDALTSESEEAAKDRASKHKHKDRGAKRKDKDITSSSESEPEERRNSSRRSQTPSKRR